MLGSSTYGAQVAAFFGLPYCYAYFFTEGQGAMEALDLYRENYRPSAANPLPYSTIAVSALAAETQEEALRLHTSREAWRAEFERGRFVPLPTPEEAASYPFTEAERQRHARIPRPCRHRHAGSGRAAPEGDRGRAWRRTRW